MPSEQHEQWKHDLFDHLDSKLSGCIACEIGESRDSHTPLHRGRHRALPADPVDVRKDAPSHPRSAAGGGLRRNGAESNLSGKWYQVPPRYDSARHPQNAHRIRGNRKVQPSIELVGVAKELDIPLFTILAPDRQSLVLGLHPSRPWWDFDRTLPEDTRRQMYFMEQVADELMRRHSKGDSTWSELGKMLDDAGNLQFARFRSSPPDLSRAGDLIVAELCSWDCENAMKMLEHKRIMDEQDAVISGRQTLAEDVGEILLSAMRTAVDGVARFVVPVGTEEVHVEMSLQPLNPDVERSGRRSLDLSARFAEAAEKARSKHRRSPAGSYSNEKDVTH